MRRAQRIVGVLVRPFQLSTHRSRNPILNVCIGCGFDIREGWLNTDYGPNRLDVVFLDACRRLPFANASVDRYYAEHMIEHIRIPFAESMLKECVRTLKPGGRIRLVTPDLRNLVRLLTDAEAPEIQRYAVEAAGYGDQRRFKSPVMNPVRTFNIAVRDWGHEFIYDFETLKGLLEASGFSGVRRLAVNVSDDPGFQNIERHHHSIGEFMNTFESMVVEAEKPA